MPNIVDPRRQHGRSSDSCLAQADAGRYYRFSMSSHFLDGEVAMKVFAWITLPVVCAVAWMAFAESPARGDRKLDNRFFELRTYYAAPGKMADLHTRFRDHTCKLFEKHGMTIIGFWSPDKPEDAEKKLIYILAFPSKEAKEKAWKAFQADPEWQKVKAESEKNGKLVDKVESVPMKPTDYSAMK
jgi:hypothetical protein